MPTHRLKRLQEGTQTTSSVSVGTLALPIPLDSGGYEIQSEDASNNSLFHGTKFTAVGNERIDVSFWRCKDEESAIKAFQLQQQKDIHSTIVPKVRTCDIVEANGTFFLVVERIRGTLEETLKKMKVVFERNSHHQVISFADEPKRLLSSPAYFMFNHPLLWVVDDRTRFPRILHAVRAFYGGSGFDSLLRSAAKGRFTCVWEENWRKRVEHWRAEVPELFKVLYYNPRTGKSVENWKPGDRPMVSQYSEQFGLITLLRNVWAHSEQVHSTDRAIQDVFPDVFPAAFGFLGVRNAVWWHKLSLTLKVEISLRN